MSKLPWSIGRLIARTHTMFAVTILFFVTAVMASQVALRGDFASTELYDDVMERWGTPIEQPVPSVRFVEHGAVFHELEPMPLTRQVVTVDAEMNYRKRGLVYFSGFDFQFQGDYGIRNDRDYPIDVAFVFPLSVERARVLLSDLSFSVNGEPEAIALREGDDKLLWTGRVGAGEEVSFDIAYRGRGLDTFRYLLDPALPVRGLDLTLNVTGGDNFDYPPGVVPATESSVDGDTVSLRWQYDALEAGVPMGAVLPSEKGFDDLITTMTVRAWVPFGLFFAGLVTLGVLNNHRFRFHETVLVVSAYSFFYVLLPYLAAFTNFYLAFAASFALTAAIIVLYLAASIGPKAARQGAWLLVGGLFTPSVAVMIQGYTGLIYTLEIFAALCGLMYATTRPGFQAFVKGVQRLAAPTGTPAPDPIY
jgi:hypothetical protein